MDNRIIPRLSSDIDFHKLNKNDFFIHQTKFDHRIKISTEFYDFIQLIDNKKTINEIVSQYNLNHRSNLTNEFAFDFLYNKLAKYGIIESDNIQVQSSTKPSYLKLSFIVLNEKRVSMLTRYLKFLFFPKVIIILFLFSFFVLTFSFFFYSNEIFHTNIQKSSWLFFFFISFIGVTFHEFGHASAAHFYGAKHGGIGGGFYLFMPVYFADVTDVWKLTKSRRIMVNLAGVYFEIIYSSLIILVGLIFNYKFLIILPCIFSLSILYNLNPFLRSDGYWVLSDVLEKPNLMSHGFIKVKQILKSKKNWSHLDYFLLIYGLISHSFVLFFVYYVLIINPNSILYFPENLKHFFLNLFSENPQFSLSELGKLFIPILFFYLMFGLIKNFFVRKS